MSDETEYRQRLSPKLRMIINGDADVNGYRAAMSAAVTSESRTARRAHVELAEAAVRAEPDSDLGELPSRKAATDAALVSCFIHLNAPKPAPTGDLPIDIEPSAQKGNLATIDLTPAQVARLSRGRGENAFEQGIAYVEAGVPLSQPAPTRVVRSLKPPEVRVDIGADPGEGAQSQDGAEDGTVIVGIIDVGGFDFAHPDFMRDGKTRFAAIWDQGATPPPEGGEADEEEAVDGFPTVDYGAVLSAEDMNRAILDAAEVKVDPSDFLPQSIMQVGSHGTHVASIAAGNKGVCPQAILVGVTIALTAADTERRSTLYDSARLAHAVDYLFDVGLAMNRPVVINISLGTNGHAHDGTSPISRWIDASLGRPGRCVCVAAGNSGQEAALFEGDIGYTSGRIHASGRIPAAGLIADMKWQVVGNGIVDVSENEMEIWYRPGDEFCVQVHSPDGFVSEWVGPGEFYENLPLESNTFLSIYNERYHPANGGNRISVFLSPRLKAPIVGIQPGTWTVRLKGIDVRDGRYDAWIERDDPRPLGRVGETDAWLFPSYFAAESNVDSNSVSALACGRDVVAVGNADSAAERIHHSSSQGPTWDGRPKPDIAAPGTDIIAARGFGGVDERQQWISMTGTSMASPFVTGVAALMLGREPRLTSTQIVGIMRRTAQPLPGSDYAWQNDAGFGVIRPDQCLALVKQPFESFDKKQAQEAREALSSDGEAQTAEEARS